METSELIKAMKIRRSCRAYAEISVDDEKISELIQECMAIVCPFDHNVELLPFSVEYSRKLYSSFTSSPCGIAFCANTDIISQSKVGFLGELLVLCATAKGYGTCWIGHYNNSLLSELLKKYSTIRVDDSVLHGFSEESCGKLPLCITPIGYEGKKNLGHKMMRSFGSKRKPLVDLLDKETDINNLSEDIIDVLNMAVIAPSAINGQFWRFNISSDMKSISVGLSKTDKSFKWNHPNLDIGIAACHIWLALQSKEKIYKLSLSETNGAVSWNFEQV